MFQFLFNRKLKEVHALFMGHYIDVKVLYALHFDTAPSVNFVGDIDAGKAYEHIKTRYRYQIEKILQHSYFDHNRQEFYFNNTIFILTDKRMIELGNNFCHALHNSKNYGWANELIKNVAAFYVAAEPVKEATRVIGFMQHNNMN